MAGKPWASHEDDVVRSQYAHTSTASIAALLGRTPSSVYQRAYVLGLHKSEEYLSSEASGRANVMHSTATHFVKGQAPHNKGRKMSEYISPRGIENIRRAQFKKGHKPHNTKWDYYERTTLDGYVEIRIAKDNFQLKHRWLWEQAHGPIPKGWVVVFKDGNRQNICLQNLELIPRTELMSRNSIVNYPPELRELIHLNSKLIKKIKAKNEE